MLVAPAHDIGDLKAARAARLSADRRASMSERLARLHALCKQLGAIKGAAGYVTADTQLGGLDVVQRARGVPSYSRLDADAVETSRK